MYPWFGLIAPCSPRGTALSGDDRITLQWYDSAWTVVRGCREHFLEAIEQVHAMNKSDFEELLLACQEIASTYPEGVVFIGGIAVYLHAVNHKHTAALAAFTHDADFYISLADMGDLRDDQELTANRRLSKHQLIKRGFEFDIYTERQSKLIVPYDHVRTWAVQYENLLVAAIEHLLVLKLEAYRDRKASSKGEKDANDLIQIGLIAAEGRNGFRPELCLGFMQQEHLELLEEIARGPQFLALARGNSKAAKDFRLKFQQAIKHLLSSK